MTPKRMRENIQDAMRYVDNHVDILATDREKIVWSPIDVKSKEATARGEYAMKIVKMVAETVLFDVVDRSMMEETGVFNETPFFEIIDLVIGNYTENTYTGYVSVQMVIAITQDGKRRTFKFVKSGNKKPCIVCFKDKDYTYEPKQVIWRLINTSVKKVQWKKISVLSPQFLYIMIVACVVPWCDNQRLWPWRLCDVSMQRIVASTNNVLIHNVGDREDDTIFRVVAPNPMVTIVESSQ